MNYDEMQPHQQRVVDEKTELNSKLSKLKEFINNSPFFRNLDGAEQRRLHNQYCIMDDYSAILQERITAFTE